jgi:lysyl-tRNA synthetase class 2
MAGQDKKGSSKAPVEKEDKLDLNLATTLNCNAQVINKLYVNSEGKLDVNLDSYLTKEKMYELCKEKNYNVQEDESYEELFYRIFLQEIEPKLKNMGAVIVYNYPAQMASLSRLSEEDSRYAERFEVYVDGLELANAFSELTDKDEQLKRLQEEQIERERQGKKVYDIDMDFIEAVGQMPKSAGIALGVDRLVQVLTSCQNIDNVLTLPSSKLFL